MNKIYRLVWNHKLQAFSVLGENSRDRSGTVSIPYSWDQETFTGVLIPSEAYPQGVLTSSKFYED